MNNTILENIPSIEINDFEKNSSDVIILSLEKFLEKNQDKALKPHRITFYQMAVITEGEGSIWIDSAKYQYSPKSAFTASKGRVMAFEFKEMPKGFVLLFAEEFINRNPGDLEWINSLNSFDLSVELPVIRLSDTEFVELLVFMKKIRLELESGRDFITDEIVFNLLKTFILIAERMNSKKTGAVIKGSVDKSYVFEFKKKLETMYSNSRTVNYYAGQLGITPRKLNQLTYNFCGISAKQLIEDRVLLETKRLLTHTQMTIKEIGHSLGFNDPTNFNKFFKRYIKQTPLEYRELNRKTNKSRKTAEIDHFQMINSSDN